jgi:hypothetical protein
MISGNMVGMYSTLGKTFIFEDSDGNEVTGVITEQMTILDVTDSDVRKGVIYAGDEGIRVGTQEIPPYIYALIDESGLCYEVCGTSKNYDGVNGYVSISIYDSNYIDKYYNINDGQWYLDSSFKFVLE